MSGIFITLEGGEGTGKSTQAKILAEKLSATGQEVILSREPGGSPLAERIRSLILSGEFKTNGPDIEAVMFAAARSDHMRCLVLPALERGAIVVCDRFFDSTTVYQTISGADENLLKELRQEATGGRFPDLTLILDVDSEIAGRRAALRRGEALPDRFESEGNIFHSKVREGFRFIAKNEPERCVMIDASGDQQVVETRIWEAVRDRIPQLGNLVFP